jgi:hypothetical protein
LSERNGRAVALTVLTPMHSYGAWLSRVGYWFVRRLPIITDVVGRLGFIHFARWWHFDKIAENGPPHRRESLRYTYLMFEANYNGDFDSYIETFSYVLPIRMWSTWGPCFGFPGAQPATQFKRYIRHNELPVDHFYAAYPDASASMVVAALRLRDRFEAFQAETVDLDADHFAAAFRRFLRVNQRLL